MAFSTNITSPSIVEAISSFEYSSPVKRSDAMEMRKEYLSIVNNKDLKFEAKRENIYQKLVAPVYTLLNIAPTSQAFECVVIDKKQNKMQTMNINEKLICMGRYKGNNISLCDENDESISLSRIQAFMFVVGQKIVLFDMWSVSGTYLIERSNKNEKCVSTLPDKRAILLFDKNEIIHLQFRHRIDLLIKPQNANKKQLQLFDIYKYIQLQQNQQNKNKNDDDIDDEKKEEIIHNKKQKKLNKKQEEFKNWICDKLGLEEYYNNFIENGFDEIDVVLMSFHNEKDLEDIGINKKGSRIKILMYIEKEKNKNNNSNNDKTQVEGGKNTNFI